VAKAEKSAWWAGISFVAVHLFAGDGSTILFILKAGLEWRVDQAW
jgi:hypothetical protein